MLRYLPLALFALPELGFAWLERMKKTHQCYLLVFVYEKKTLYDRIPSTASTAV